MTTLALVCLGFVTAKIAFGASNHLARRRLLDETEDQIVHALALARLHQGPHADPHNDTARQINVALTTIRLRHHIKPRSTGGRTT